MLFIGASFHWIDGSRGLSFGPPNVKISVKIISIVNRRESKTDESLKGSFMIFLLIDSWSINREFYEYN